MPWDEEDAMAAQADEFDAAFKFAEQVHRIGMTAVVDDDYPAVRRAYEAALMVFIQALVRNRRI